MALRLARELQDPVMQAEVLCQLGWGSLQHDRFSEARGYLEAARQVIIGQEGYLLSFIEFGLSGVFAGLGHHRRAFWHANVSLGLLHADVGGAASRPLQAMARARQMAGDHVDAVALCKRALRAESAYEAPRIHALLMETLGESLRGTGDVERAIGCWREALTIFEEGGDHRAPELRDRLAKLVSATSG
ncbi:hypothetical protein BBK82_17110 [Lentzea guizhouensis]|uniref:MalT-like TPR region domain-containing protein n=1 Tax=Lentzea guizhouensis TaxID=1586287 RepID=A0A1B2HII3_9PSEU|nr:hypothetical protein [Lentzea guizhouensis]ANZ37516.1 hypothetical protein BBK82_17110 [Lentzea guizhouensis]